MPRRPIGRFQVMALLQAARAFLLGLPEERAKSWGLNRAIFYAAAKRGFVGGRPAPPGGRPARREARVEGEQVFELGDEKAYQRRRGNRLWFAIGGDVQEAEDYDREIAPRFGDLYERAWREALEIVKGYDEATLKSQRRFYEEVYRPRRDELAARWSAMAS